MGRTAGCDVFIDDESVSGTHCEITLNGDSVIVRDLGSTNGIFLDGVPVREVMLVPGQRWQAGSVELALVTENTPPAPLPAGTQACDAASGGPAPIAAGAPFLSPPRAPLHTQEYHAAPLPPSAPIAYVPDDYAMEAEPPSHCKYHPREVARFLCPHCQFFYCELCVSARPGGTRTGRFCRRCSAECIAVHVQLRVTRDAKENFLASVPGAFLYPFQGSSGFFVLLLGPILFALSEMFFTFAVFIRPISRVFILGYLFAFMQKIIQTAAQGEDDAAAWPDTSEFVQDLLVPGFQLLAVCLVSFGPALGLVLWTGIGEFLGDSADPGRLLWIVLLASLGAIYFPMALLAVAMHETVLALNPFVVIPAMGKAPLEYFIVLLVFALAVGCRIVGILLSSSFLPVPGVATFISMFGALYFLIVCMRLLGLLYFAKRSELGWLRGGSARA